MVKGIAASFLLMSSLRMGRMPVLIILETFLVGSFSFFAIGSSVQVCLTVLAKTPDFTKAISNYAIDSDHII